MDFKCFTANVIKGPFFLELVKWVYPIQVYAQKYFLAIDRRAITKTKLSRKVSFVGMTKGNHDNY